MIAPLHAGMGTVETLPVLAGLNGLKALFIGRVPGADVSCDRSEAMDRLAPTHLAFLQERGLGSFPLVTAEQVHGKEVSMVTTALDSPVPGVDGLLTIRKGLTLGIYVADCAPVWIVARDGSSGGLLHSGKKGTELGIVREGITKLSVLTGKKAEEFLVVIGPCIRPPCYEVDFAMEIARQARRTGSDIHDSGICTACHPERYYSYRREKGLTGRMLATLTLLP